MLNIYLNIYINKLNINVYECFYNNNSFKMLFIHINKHITLTTLVILVALVFPIRNPFHSFQNVHQLQSSQISVLLIVNP